MRQYHAVKEQVPGALLFFRLGDFYEMFLDDAITASRELEITLTARNKEKGQAIPMCGVPFHSAEGYIARLISRGYRVAICDQVEEAGPSLEKSGKRLVRREVTRIVHPAPRPMRTCFGAMKITIWRRFRAPGQRPGWLMSMCQPGNFERPSASWLSWPGCWNRSARVKF